MSADRPPDPDPFRADSAKLIYSSRLLYASAGLFAIAGAIWLFSANGAAIGLLFLAVAAAMAVAGRAASGHR